jgi:hypothetical protein
MKSSLPSPIPLKIGSTYRALIDIPSLLEKIEAGDVLIFDRMEYSPYDNMNIFIFTKSLPSLNAVVRWTLFDSSPEPEWTELFEKVSD